MNINNKKQNIYHVYMRRGIIITIIIVLIHAFLFKIYGNNNQKITSIASILSAMGSTIAFVWIAISTWYQSKALEEQARAIQAQTRAVEIQQEAFKKDSIHKDIAYIILLMPLIHSRIEKVAKEIARELDTGGIDKESTYVFEENISMKQLMHDDIFLNNLEKLFPRDNLIRETAGAYTVLFENYKNFLLTHEILSEEKNLL